MRKRILLSAAVLISTKFFSQTWVEMMHEPGKTFYEVQAAANEYFSHKDINEPGNGYKPYKRWENYMESRVFPSGDLSLPSKNLENFQEFLKQNSTGNKSSTSASTTYTAMGPMGPMTGLATNGFPRKAGRDNFIAFHPTSPTTFWAGAPAGGLWKTTDGGITWTTNTDNLSVIGCSDLAIDPSNPNTMYLATGDGDAGDTYCIGVLKSIDGGLTWNSTGLTFTVNQLMRMRRLIINPSNPQILLAATSSGVRRTTDGGVTWTTVLTGDWYDLEFKPGDPNTVYLGGTASFRLSNDAGATFTAISNGFPTSGSNRLSVAVTPADPTYVYVLRSSSSTNGFAGLYRSTSSGTAFTVMSTSPDVLANKCTGATGGGQGYYDLACAASPLNANEVVVGGVNVWRSTNGGTSLLSIGCWTGTGSSYVYLKADHHDLKYNSLGELFTASDGGIFKYNTTNWIDLNNQRNIAQIYKIGASALTANKWVSGHQDNGTGIYTNGTYQASYAGDGMDCFIDRTNNSNIFVSNPQGNFSRTTNGGASYNYINVTSTSYSVGAWVSPWKQDPVVASRLYIGLSQLFVSNDLGVSWTQAGTTGLSGTIKEFAIAPSNNQVIYILQGNNSIRKTIDGGNTWLSVASVSSLASTFITIDPNDENNVWITVSGYTTGNKIFQTINGGTSWTNISFNLPNLPANCSVYQLGTNDRLYIGMDVGVYTKDNSSTTWTLYNAGLPNVPISDFEISPAAPSLLRVATYGRGVYQVDLIQATTIPTSNFVATGTVCSGVSKTFIDNSSESPTGWNWSVAPSAGVILNTSNSQNPSITFPAGGTYTVSLTASNGFGAGSVATKTISVMASPVLTLTSSGSSQTVCVDEDVTLTANGANTYTWLPNATNGSTLNFIATLADAMTYTVNAKSTNGCAGTETLSVMVSECVGINKINLEKEIFDVYPNPANNHVTIKSRNNSNSDVQLELIDASGKLVMQQTAHFKKDKNEQQLNISNIANGIYILKIKTEDGTSQQIKLVKE